MINLNEIKARGALTLLRKYNGKNPYLKKMKLNLDKKGKVSLTKGQVEYINKFHDTEPQLINKVVEISEYLGTQLQEQYELSFKPERILIEFMLADQEKTYHVYGKLKRNQEKSGMYFLPKTQVLDDPYFTNCDISVDWDKYTKMDINGRTPYEHQKSGIEFLLCRDGAILADDMGLGKAISTSESVYCPTGKVKMGDIKVGDYVIGSNGEKTKVTAVYPQPIKEMYKITFNDGYSTTCCGEHMWTVMSNNGSVNNKNREVRYINLTVNQMLDKDLELTQIGIGWNEKRPYKFKTYYKQSNGQNKWQIPIVKPIQFENDYALPINPYLLGVSLGDGHINKNGYIKIGIHKDDFNEIFNNQILNEITGNDSVRINHITTLREEITSLNLNGTLSHTKFIPELYKYTSIEDRLLLLQGLMDTDGHCMKSKNGNFVGTEYCTVSEQLADDVAEIVHSLGGIVRKKSKIGSYKKIDGAKVECKRVYRLNIKLPDDMNPFRLKRKADEYNTPKKYKVGRYIKDITSIGEGESVCIKVNAEDSLFTLNHGIVTHNTYQSIIAALECGAKKVLIVCPSSMKISWQREIEAFGEKATIISGSRWPSYIPKFTIINFDILKNFHSIGPQEKDKEGNLIPQDRDLVNQNYDLIIIDEAHKVKDHKSQRGKIIGELTVEFGIPKVWLLTGTPIANRPMDFYNLLKLVRAKVADNWMFFAKRYCDGKKFYKKLKNGNTRQIWITKGASNLDELAIRTRNKILRRVKNEVLDMPAKTISTHYHKLSSRATKEYENLWDEYMEKRLREGKRRVSSLHKDIVELGLLRKFIAMEAIPYTVELAKDAIEQGQKVVIFTTFTDELEEIADNFGRECVIHNGQMSMKNKQNSVDSFQNDPKTKVFVGNIMSAGVGITLTEGTVVIFNSFDWVPGNNEQAEDRCIFGDQWVMTDEGYKMIQDIKIGDKVYTHKGNFKNVIDKTSKLERKKLRYDINAFGFNEDLSVTHDHKIFVYNSLNENFIWKEAKDLDIRYDKLTLKSLDITSRKDKLKINNYISEDFNNNFNVSQKNGRLITLPEEINLTNEILYAFGFFIADGWTSISDSKSSTVNVCQKITNSKMYDASEYIINVIKKGFNIDKHSSYVDKNGVKTCTIHSKNLALNFKEWFGETVDNKQLPIWVDELSKEQLTHLLDGYYHGDGYRRNNTQQATTSSIKLISQLVRYNANLGRSVSISNKGEKNYSIEYSLDDIRNKRILKIDGYITYPIKSINISKPKRGEERVYDLSVDDDHSFIVGNYNVHNCYRIGQQSNVSVYYQLFKDTISIPMWGTIMNKMEVINQIIGGGGEDAKRLQMLLDELEENRIEI